MKSGSSFLIAARRCEIAELERLARTSELVNTLGRLIHTVQRERGISNVFLASRGARFAQERVRQMAQTDLLAREALLGFDGLDTDSERLRNGARLFSRVAVVLHAIEGLPALRMRVAAFELDPSQSTAAYMRLVSALLNVVFEAADSAGDPEVSRALVALFNFMQGKEFAGQERALGGAMFASGCTDPPSQRHWRHLVEQQQACFQIFIDFSEPAVVAAHRESESPAALAELERLRRVGATCEGSVLDPTFSQHWYECCTRRIDAMREIEDLLEANLRRLCQARIARARSELRDQQAILESLAREAGADCAGAPMHYGQHLERSMLELLHQQSGRLQAMGDELEKVRATLTERKVVERAKGLLMAHRQLTEDEAYKMLRQLAMNQKRRLADVAEAVLAMADVLPRAAP